MSDCTDFFRDTIQQAVANQHSLSIQGGGSKFFLGRPVDNHITPLSTLEHSGIVNYEPVELVMTARAGTTLAVINNELAKHHQMLACDPPQFQGKATVGGSLAANQSGPARPWLGSLRDHVLGVNLINGRGEHLRFGGRVMKNVAGYDVSRLQAGAMGTLGLITEISFKVLPIPESSLTLTREATQSQAIHLMNQLSAQPKPLTGACWCDGVLWLRLAGANSAVQATAKQWGGDKPSPEKAEQFWQNLREQQLDFFQLTDAQNLWRFSINSATPALLDNESWLLDWAGSVRWLKSDIDFSTLQTCAQHGKGEVVSYRRANHADHTIFQSNHLSQTAALEKLHKKLKQAFDPHGVFNPGRLYIDC